MRLRALRHPPALAIWDAGYDDEGWWDATRAAAAAAVAVRSRAAPRRKRARPPETAASVPASAPVPVPAPDAAMEDVYDGDTDESM